MQEIMAKPPKGYRAATPAERDEITNSGMSITLMGALVGQRRAEFDAAKLRLSDALREANVADANRKAVLEKIGLEGKAGDLHVSPDGNSIYILVDPKHRVDQWPPPPAQIPAKAEKTKAPKPVKESVEEPKK